MQTEWPMLHSKFGKESLPQKKKSSIRSFVYFGIFLCMLYSVYWTFINRQRIMFYVKKGNYATIINNINEYEHTMIDMPDHNRKLFDATSELLADLIKDNTTDSYLYYLYGRLLTIECTTPLINNADKLTNIFFLDYIKKK